MSRGGRDMATARLCGVMAWLVTASPGAAAEIQGVRFADRVRAGETELVLVNVGLLRYRIFIKAYVAALYLAPGDAPDRLLEDVPKRLEIEYFYKIEAEGFVEATKVGIAANVGAAALAELQPRIARLNALYRGVRPGDRYALTYVPRVGTELALNGRPLGVIAGPDFAAAVFSIWLGPRPIDAPLKAKLLESGS